MNKRFIISIFIMIIIFYFSHQPADLSNQSSGSVLDVLKPFFDMINISNDLGMYIVRKTAHFSVYYILGTSLMFAFISSTKSNKALYLSLLIIFIYACSDEFHQLFISGRSGMFSDVILDTCGGLLGIIIFMIIYKKRK